MAKGRDAAQLAIEWFSRRRLCGGTCWLGVMLCSQAKESHTDYQTFVQRRSTPCWQCHGGVHRRTQDAAAPLRLWYERHVRASDGVSYRRCRALSHLHSVTRRTPRCHAARNASENRRIATLDCQAFPASGGIVLPAPVSSRQRTTRQLQNPISEWRAAQGG